MALSPAMQQYLNIKEQHKNEILFFRLGDFYEMFFEDAKLVSSELELVLTGKDCGLSERAPMCGIPHHSAEVYIKKLIDRGYHVAICEQMENPAQAKGIVRRAVVRVISPGTVIESSMLDEEKNNFICSIYREGDTAGVCFCDISTGEIYANCIADDVERGLVNEIGRFVPSEIISNTEFSKLKGVMSFVKEKIRASFSTVEGEQSFDAMKDFLFSAFKNAGIRDSISDAPEQTLRAISNLIAYLDKIQMNGGCRITSINFYNETRYMNLDITARRNLEVTETMRSKEKKGSLLGVLDKTKTAMGKRLMRSFVEQPLLNPALIERRLNAVEELYKNSVLSSELALLMTGMADIERLITRVVYSTANPRELKALQYACERLPELKAKLSESESRVLTDTFAGIDTLEDIAKLIGDAIDDNAPAVLKDGDIIKAGYDPVIDDLRSLVKNTKGYIAAIEAQEKEETGIKNLKIGYNRVFGYYIEVTKSFMDLVPAHYIRKQTLANCERYITEELKTLEGKILSASTQIIELEHEVFSKVRNYVGDQLFRVQKTADSVAHLDVFVSLAQVALANNYVRPTITMGTEIVIKDGRHPVVESLLKDVPFVANDTNLNNGADRISIITGPNMAGKSTYMRQVALIVLMAQIGSFVPASSATIGVVDSIFTRVGASDDLSMGQSTFMVEMNEVSMILKNATSKSLVILDEVGRGTSTFDGMSIARAVVEYIADPKKIGAKTLFATHYHELTSMEEELDCVKNYNIAVKKRGDDITFLRRIVKGAADDSYGIEVAKLAGVPDAVVHRAKEILKSLENDKEIVSPKSIRASHSDDRYEVLSVQTMLGDSPSSSRIMKILENTDLETLTPIEALNKLYELKKISQE